MVLRYGVGQKFDQHADDGSLYPRTVSMTAYLNDNYDGGELEYTHFGVSFKPSPGDVIIFPSNYPYQHRVVPVTGGLRYAIVNWFRWSSLAKNTTTGDNSGVKY
jgi:predicted 2-oxoglutarate/Fe(II)-dependent dioxygenase YbiX